MATEPVHRRITVDDYHHLLDAGILSEDDRVELIDGEIVAMGPIGGRHVACVNNLTQLLTAYIGDSAMVSIQNPVRIGEFQEPEPDVAIIRRRSYGDDLPATKDVLLLMEVSITSLDYDRRTKLPLYAAAGIPEVWLVDVPGEAIERHTNPADGVYRLAIRAGRGESIASLALPHLTLTTDDVLA
ncbi:MAG TPA: Uma2 family endonuclease [Chloroflexota bacterium]|nr:Uma2 family endonuclease [Chloroflexota bacterium]